MPATNAWFRSRFFSSPGCRRIRCAPDLEGQRRIVRVRAQLVVGQAGHAPVDPGRQRGRPCPSGSGRGSGPRPPRRRPAASRRRASSGRHRAAVPRAPRTRGRRAVLVGSFSPGAASWKRPVSIGLTTTRSRSKLEEQELAAPPKRRRAAARRGRRARPACRARRADPGAAVGGDRRGPARAAWNASATIARSGSSGTAGRL